LPHHFFRKYRIMRIRSQRGTPWEPKEGHHVVQLAGCMVGPIFHLVGPTDANFGSTDSSWPKTDYIYPPLVTSWWGGRETINAQYGSADCGDRWEDVVGAAPGFPFDSIDTISFSTMMKREQFTLVLWDCGSNLYQTISRASLIRVTWATYHDCDHICITSMVDLIFLRWFMRCRDVYVLHIWVDVYVTQFLYACWSN
jgi:hypothetical protein